MSPAPAPDLDELDETLPSARDSVRPTPRPRQVRFVDEPPPASERPRVLDAEAVVTALLVVIFVVSLVVLRPAHVPVSVP